MDEWLASNSSFHIMHDHPGHCMAPVQGGMWGGKAPIPDIKCAIERCQAKGKPLQGGDDLKRLRESVWPVIEKDVMHHDMFCCRSVPHSTRSKNTTLSHSVASSQDVSEGSLDRVPNEEGRS